MGNLQSALHKLSRDRRTWTLAACALVLCATLIGERVLQTRQEAALQASNVPTASGAVAFRGGARNQRVATILCNVYTDPASLSAILDVLGREGVPASFFVGGAFTRSNEALLRRAVAEGHEIANHGDQHRMHSGLSLEQNAQEISTAQDRIEKACGVRTTLFAPPSGDFNARTLDVAQSLGYRTVLWTHDTIDWRDQSVDTLVQRATQSPENGMMILTHPTPATAAALPEIIARLRAEGFAFVTASASLDALEAESPSTATFRFLPVNGMQRRLSPLR